MDLGSSGGVYLLTRGGGYIVLAFLDIKNSEILHYYIVLGLYVYVFNMFGAIKQNPIEEEVVQNPFLWIALGISTQLSVLETRFQIGSKMRLGTTSQF